MPKIRLNKAVKEFNISISRLVEFLDSKGIEVENNPNAQLDDTAYAALKAEFAQDGEQRKASQEVVLSKVPEEKLEIEEQKNEVIRAKGTLKAETKVLGKIDLNPKKEEEKEKEPDPAPAPEITETVKAEKPELKILGKVGLEEISEKKTPKKPESKNTGEKAPEEKGKAQEATPDPTSESSEPEKNRNRLHKTRRSENP